MATRKPAAEAGDETTTDETTAGTLVRLDDPEQEGTPQYAIACSDGYVVRLPHPVKYELQLYPIG